MIQRIAIARRSPVEWAIRIGIAMIAAIFGYYSVTFSAAKVIATSNTALAHRLAPYDGQVTAELSASLSLSTSLTEEGSTLQARNQADQLARHSLRQSLIAVPALTTLGINADIRGERAMARRLFNHAQRLSRRDLRTQLWMIEDAVNRGEVGQALHQYDMTLRVFPRLSEILYPILTAASSDVAIRDGLTATIGSRPPWSDNFLNYAAANSRDPLAVASIFSALLRAHVPVSDFAKSRIVDSLIAADKHEAAWSFYESIRPGSDRRRSRDPQFKSGLEYPSQFDWIAISDVGITATVQNGLFDFSVSPSLGGPVLKQLQLLPPGRYRLKGVGHGIEQDRTALPYWALLCQGGDELGRVLMTSSEVANGAFAGIFEVPPSCPVQNLILTVRPSTAIAGVSGQINRVELAAVRMKDDR